MAPRGLVKGARIVACLVAWTFCSTARAAGKGQDQALAEALFDQSITLMKAGDYASACPKLAESQRLDPAPGTLLYLGDCYEKTGRLATAWATFREAIALSSSSSEPKRADLARTRAAALEKRLPWLRAELPGTSNVHVLTLDGTEIGRALWGSELPIDPGEHTLVASAPDHASRTIPFRVEGGEHRIISIANLEDAAPTTGTPSPPPPPHAAAPAPPVERSAAVRPDPPGRPWQKPVALGVAGAGVIGLGLGTFFGLQAFSRWGDAEPLCPADRCSPRGVALAGDARSAATMSTVAFVVGSILLGAGAALYLFAPKRTTTGVAPTYLTGAF